jgi:hypothetical protein
MNGGAISPVGPSKKEAPDDLARRFATHRLTVAFPSDGYFVAHDRVIYLHLNVQDASRFYKVILGQGLFGFDAACRRRSHGVWFEVEESEWNTNWET